MGKFIWCTVKRSHPCPVCGKKDKCRVSPSLDDAAVVGCYRSPDYNGAKAFKTKTDTVGECYYHRIKDNGLSRRDPGKGASSGPGVENWDEIKATYKRSMKKASPVSSVKTEPIQGTVVEPGETRDPIPSKAKKRRSPSPRGLKTKPDEESPILSTETPPSGDWGGSPSSQRGNLETEDSETAELRDAVYKRLLELCPPCQRECDELARRGLEPKTYGTLPGRTEVAKIVAQLYKDFDDYLLKVPGFTTLRDGRPRLFFKSGLMIPCFDRKGRICRIVIRNPDPATAKAQRYRPLSGGKNVGDDSKGPSVGVPPHWARVPQAGEPVILTEGELKANYLAQKFPDLGVVSVPGVGSWRASKVIDDCEALGAKTVRLAYDADAADNRDVARALLGLAAGLGDAGLGVEILTWDATQKGIDDALRAGLEITTLSETLASDWLEALAQKHGLKPNGDEPDDPRPKIHVGEPEEKLLRKILDFLKDYPFVFVKNGSLVTPLQVGNTTRLNPLDHRALAAFLADGVQFIKFVKNKITQEWDEVRAEVPVGIVMRVCAVAGLPDFSGPRPIVGVLNGPTVNEKGELINTVGYHKLAGYGYYLASPVAGLEIPVLPTLAQCRDAVDRIHEVVLHFPWADELQFIKWLTGLFTVIVRPMLNVSPVLFIQANRAGGGKSYLTKILGLIPHGAVPPEISWPEDKLGRDRELKNELVGKVSSGLTMAAIDNVPDGEALQSPLLCQFATSPEFTARQFHDNSGKHVGGVNHLFLVVNGNNIQASGDLAQRAITVRLESPLEDPRSQPVEQFGPMGDALAYCSEPSNRRELLTDLLTIIAGWIRNGSPKQKGESWGTFLQFVEGPVAMVRWVTGLDPLSDRKEALEDDPETEAIGEIWRGIKALVDGDAFTVGELLKAMEPPEYGFGDREKAQNKESLREALNHFGFRNTPQGLGRILRRLENRIVQGEKLVRRKTTGNMPATYQLVAQIPARDAGKKGGNSPNPGGPGGVYGVSCLQNNYVTREKTKNILEITKKEEENKINMVYRAETFLTPETPQTLPRETLPFAGNASLGPYGGGY